MLEYRRLSKLVGTYLGNLKDSIDPASDGRVHAKFHQTGAATGRLSSSDPNLQNIPIRTEVGRQIRRAFVAEPGHVLISADYSQIELRMLAHQSGDPNLTEAFKNDRDIHAAVASHVFGVPLDQVSSPNSATHAKVINFGIVYGVTAYGLARRIEGLDNDSAKKLIGDYKQALRRASTSFLAKVHRSGADAAATSPRSSGRRRADLGGEFVQRPDKTTRRAPGDQQRRPGICRRPDQGSDGQPPPPDHRKNRLPMKMLLADPRRVGLRGSRRQARMRRAAVIRQEMEHAYRDWIRSAEESTSAIGGPTGSRRSNRIGASRPVHHDHCARRAADRASVAAARR